MLVDRALRRLLRWSLHTFLFTITFVTTAAFLEENAQAQDAKTLFDEGWAFMEQNRFDEACAKFEQSLKASGATAAVQSLAECEGKRGRNAAAYNLWAQTASRLPEGSPDRARAASKQAELAPKVALLVVALLPDAPPDAKITVGNAEVKAGAETAFDPGHYTIAAEAQGRTPARREVDVTAGVRQKIEVTLAAIPTSGGDGGAPPPVVPPPTTEQPDTEPSHGLRTAGIVVGAVGVVGLGVAIGTWVPMLGAQSDFESGELSAQRANRKVDDYAVVNGIALVTGIVGVAVGVTLIIVDAATTSGSSAPQGTVAITAGPGSVGVRATF